MHLTHMLDKKINGKVISAYSSSLENVLINKDVLKIVFLKQEYPEDLN